MKIFRNKGHGSAKASIDYLLGKNRDRELATIVKGNPELSLALANNLKFSNKYTVGCLSFEEKDVDEIVKKELIQSFEDTIFAGLTSEQYNISWIEHKDKGRLELNFFIPNIELNTGKRLQPYYHKQDQILIDSWMQIQNDKYNLSDPHNPEKKQLNKILFSQDTKHADIKKQIGNIVMEGIETNIISNRDDVISLLKDNGFSITRTTNKSISISHPDLNKRNYL